MDNLSSWQVCTTLGASLDYWSFLGGSSMQLLKVKTWSIVPMTLQRDFDITVSGQGQNNAKTGLLDWIWRSRCPLISFRSASNGPTTRSHVVVLESRFHRTRHRLEPRRRVSGSYRLQPGRNPTLTTVGTTRRRTSCCSESCIYQENCK